MVTPRCAVCSFAHANGVNIKCGSSRCEQQGKSPKELEEMEFAKEMERKALEIDEKSKVWREEDQEL